MKAAFLLKKNLHGFLCRLLDVLEVIAPFKQFQKLREFMTTKLPDGFPVKIGNYTCITVLGVLLAVLYWIEKKSSSLMYFTKYAVKVYCLINSYVV